MPNRFAFVGALQSRRLKWLDVLNFTQISALRVLETEVMMLQ